MQLPALLVVMIVDEVGVAVAVIVEEELEVAEGVRLRLELVVTAAVPLVIEELLAIIDTIKHWRVYALSSPKLTILSDHKNLTGFTTTKKLNGNGRHIRWAQELAQYDFKIIHTPGKDNQRADALSRRHDLVGEASEVNEALLMMNPDGSLGPTKHLRQLNAMFTIKGEVPEELQESIIRQHHDDPIYGHPGIKRTIELIQRNYEFKGISSKVYKYIKKYATYQKNKHSTHAPYGELQTMPVPIAP